MSVDDPEADHSIGDELTHVIWAFGQVFPNYFHRPWSGIEAGTAQNDRFYQEDELKYHGTRDRGATSINFFGKPYPLSYIGLTSYQHLFTEADNDTISQGM